MHLVVYGLRNAGLTDHLAALLDRTAEGGVWGAALGTGVIAAVLSSVMNNMPTVLVGALSIDATNATGAVKEAMIYADRKSDVTGKRVSVRVDLGGRRLHKKNR